MPKISMWNPVKGADYEFADRVASENLWMGAEGLLIHKYEGPPGGDFDDISDSLFLEIVDRQYSDTVYELRGHSPPEDVDYDLSQFGIFLSSDTIRIVFHYRDMINLIGRKIIAGDVIEMTSKRDTTLSGVAINKYYVVQDSLYSAQGTSMTWYPHLWKVRAKEMPASSEYQDVLDKAASGETAGREGDGTGIMPAGWADLVGPDGTPGFGCDPKIQNALSAYCKLIGIGEEVVADAECNVFYDPKFFEVAHLWINIDEETGYPLVEEWRGGDGRPPNGAPLKGVGTAFPPDMEDGEYFLRVDYVPDRLFQKQGNCYALIESDLRRIWTGYNKRLESFMDNINISTLDDGTQIREKQALSKVVPARKDLNADHKKETLLDKILHDDIAKKLDGAS